MTESCATCRFFLDFTNNQSVKGDGWGVVCKHGRCRRYAPGSRGYEQPEVLKSDWCGEYEPAPQFGTGWVAKIPEETIQFDDPVPKFEITDVQCPE